MAQSPGSPLDVLSSVGRRFSKNACGFDLDSVLAYTTVKHVRIHDRRLGCFHYMWQFMVILYILGYEIFYKNVHYKMLDVKGTSRITIQQPTEDCNPNKNTCNDRLTPLSELPYCKDYKGPPNPINENYASKCVHVDQHELLPAGMLGRSMLVPTRIDELEEERSCEPEGPMCKKMWKWTKHHEDVFVADIEEFTLMMVSSYHRGGVKGTSADIQGFYYECRKDGKVVATDKCTQKELDIVPIKCKPGLPKPCKFEPTGYPPSSTFLSKHTEAADDSKDVFAIPDGDIMTMRKILELAGLTLNGCANHDNEILRMRGTIVNIMIEYENIKPMGGAVTPGYIYRIAEQPMNEMKTEMYSTQQDLFRHTRKIDNRHGIYVETTVEGSFGEFSWEYLLVMLSASFALLSMGTTVVDIVVRLSSYSDNKVEDVENEYESDNSYEEVKE